MDNNRFRELYIKKKSGIISLAEQHELSSLLQSNIAEENVYNTLEDFFETPLSFEHFIEAKDIDTAVARLNRRIALSQPKPVEKSSRRVWLILSAIAASLIIIIGIALLPFEKQPPANGNKNMVATKKGSKSTIVLPDGSRVWINNDTKITYDKSFGDGSREVNLVGEAYFDVVKDATRPFIVHTTTLDVKVKGTAFNVRAYPNEKNTQTTLLRGSVEVVLNKEVGKRITLKPNEKIIVQNNYAEPSLSTISRPGILISSIQGNLADSSAIETQWLKNRLAFEGDRLEDVAITLERWYNIKVVIASRALRNRKVSGVFEDRSLNNVIEALSLAVGFTYTIDQDNTLTISSN